MRPQTSLPPVAVFFLLITFLSASRTLEATTLVTPSDRVSIRLNVREGAKADTAIVGKLEKNETAALIDSVPSWYQVRLFNGVEGYVHKAWSDLVPSPPVEEARIRLGTWNTKKLGHGSSKDFAALVNVIDSNFGVFAIVEAMQKGGKHAGHDTSSSDSGTTGTDSSPDRRAPTSDRAPARGTTSSMPSSIEPGWYDRVPAGTRSSTTKDNDGGPNGVGADLFAREPAFGCFEADFDDGTPGMDFMLAAYHATFASGSAISAEVAHIDEVFTSMAAAEPGEEDLIIAGDFNRVPSQLDTLTNAADRTTGTGSTLNTKGERTGNLYDHLLVHDEAATAEMLGNARVLDVRHVSETEKVFYTSVSDHLPIMVEVRCSGPDDD